ncbi:sensor domain-containing diguanylate cyclase [Pseudorhodoferax sp.]|uniref:sensor domain-containing diguanylate cyclase n=1 Tax=Pseudorhodoferax sp. TaxID=1993553 RepID=UPI002DD63254|nr:diguanylate cyclase [Pseudorhodoferax sp.]
MTVPAAIPANEKQRLRQLHELMVLDSAPEPLFDTLARTAAEFCGAAAGLVTLIDAQRQWFKANHGLPGANETPRDTSFCAHAILDDALLHVPDATRDARFAGNPLVTGAPHIRFYAAAPLTLPEGERVGTLCVVDFQAGQLTPAQARMLEQLGRMAVQALVMRRDLLVRAVSMRGQYEQALAERENFLRTVTDNLPVRIGYIDKSRRYQFVNRAQAERFDQRPDEVLGQRPRALLKRAPDPAVSARVDAALTGQPQRFEFDDALDDGQVRRIDCQLIPHLDAEQRVQGLFTTGVDITARAESERALRLQTATLGSVAELIPAIVAVLDAHGRYRFVNGAFERWHGKPRTDIIGRTMHALLGAPEFDPVKPWIARALAGESVHFELHFPERTHAQHLAVDYIPLRLENGALDGFVAVGQDITQHRQEARRLLGLSQRDALTGLLNRAGLQDWLTFQQLHGDAAQLGLLCIDLDRFKPVNDQHGHPVGDALLQRFAERLRGLVRPTDAVVRMGGDEFAVLLPGVRDANALGTVANKVLMAAHRPFEIGTLALQIGASVGTALGLDPERGWDELLARADAMLYRAKGEGRGRAAMAPAMPRAASAVQRGP